MKCFWGRFLLTIGLLIITNYCYARSPLHIAAAKGDPVMVTKLLKQAGEGGWHVLLNEKDGDGATPLEYAVLGAALGALVGLFFGLPGILLGPFVGAVLAELLWERRNLRQAGRSGLGATIGLALGVAAKLALAFSMLGIFALVRFAAG